MSARRMELKLSHQACVLLVSVSMHTSGSGESFASSSAMLFSAMMRFLFSPSCCGERPEFNHRECGDHRQKWETNRSARAWRKAAPSLL